MAEIKESADREYYRYKCKHYCDGSGICGYFSGWQPNRMTHIAIGCTATANCPRMKRYDKLHPQTQKQNGKNEENKS